jgi:hypothetical protein
VVVRTISALVLGLLLSFSAMAEEVSLKDGTKIVGHMTAVTPDKVEVETSYGKIQLKRSDILTISFPENGTSASAGQPPSPAAAPGAAVKVDMPKVDEVLNGLQYTNRTSKFTLTMPPDWIIAPELRHSAETLATLSSRDKLRFIMVAQEEYPGSLDSYKELTMLGVRRNLSNFEELSESPTTIDGKPALMVFYRGTLSKAANLPVEFVSAIVVSGKTYTKVTAWCVEPLFRDMQPTFEKVLNSYRSANGQITAAASN